MRFDPHTPTVSAALAPFGAAVGCPQPAADRGAAANFIGVPTTNRMEGAGGPFNSWDRDIAGALRRGNAQLAQRLRLARARINLAFEIQEPVWVPTASQSAMLGLFAGAAAHGLATMKAAA